jgi:hypothetical protein
MARIIEIAGLIAGIILIAVVGAAVMAVDDIVWIGVNALLHWIGSLI